MWSGLPRIPIEARSDHRFSAIGGLPEVPLEEPRVLAAPLLSGLPDVPLERPAKRPSLQCCLQPTPFEERQPATGLPTFPEDSSHTCVLCVSTHSPQLTGT
jgi:hypothetical protein